MTPEQLKNSNIDLYNEIFNEGVKNERQRASTWIESGITNKWELRDGLKSGLTMDEYKNKEADEFYAKVDSRLNGETIIPSYESISHNQSKPDYYSQLECDEFYAEVDNLLKQ